MDRVACSDRVSLFYRYYSRRNTLFDQCGFLCMRFNLRAVLVSVSIDFEKSLLYNLPHLQLGPLDDVHTNDIHKRFLLPFPAGPGTHCLAYMGVMCHDVSGAILGAFQRSASLF